MPSQSRKQTRAERYLSKVDGSRCIPVSVATVNFMCDGNLGFVIRAMACFGAKDLHVIGSVPSYRDLTSLSGGLNKFVDIHQYSTPSPFVRKMKQEGAALISVELDARSQSLHDTVFNPYQHIVLVLGHETTGVPEEILHQSDRIVHIPMPGVGYCLNTSQAGNIVLYEIAKQLNMDMESSPSLSGGMEARPAGAGQVGVESETVVGVGL